jgi:hypothetical protein
MSNSGGSPTTPMGTPEQPFFSFPPAHILDALVDGQTYHPPSPDEPPISSLLRDGTVTPLFGNKSRHARSNVEHPNDLSDTQVISNGGQSIQAQPGESKQPDSSGGGSGRSGGKGGWHWGFLGGLVGAAGKAAGGLTKVGKDAMDFASGAGGAAAGGLAGSFAVAAGDVGGIVPSLNGIQKAFPSEHH